MEKRPELTKNLSVKDFKDFYWLKEELLNFCRTEQLDTRGGKIEIIERIEKYLKNGIREPFKSKSPKPVSTFNWNSEKLTLDTLITDNYKNTENVRSFFVEQIGNRFKFNVKFMNWMKSANGKTLKQAIDAWHNIVLLDKTDTSPKEIAPQFEYNTYIRDFLNDNPQKPRTEAIRYWKIKKSMRGSNRYHKSDLKLIGKNNTAP